MAEPNLEPLLYWVKEREQIRERKELGLAPPWTADPILREYRFCNVRRRHDRVSRWLLQNVLTAERLQEAGFDSFVMFTALCRWINWPPTIARIMNAGLWPVKRPRWGAIVELVEGLKDPSPSTAFWCSVQPCKVKVWTGAYMITARGAQPGQSKAEFIVNDVLRAGLDGRTRRRIKEVLSTERSKQAVWEILTERNNWGQFMAGQVVDDWSWTPLLWQAKDQFSWAPQGPGSVRGLNRLLGLPLRTRHSQEEWLTNLRAIRMVVINELGKQFRSITLHDAQNCLCEVDKWARVKAGEGKPRSLYKVETAYEV